MLVCTLQCKWGFQTHLWRFYSKFSTYYFFSWFRSFFLRLWDYLFLMILLLGIRPRVPIFNCILKQMLTSNETELKCLMETTLLKKKNKEREHWLTDLSRQPFGFIKHLNYSLHQNKITVPMLLSECVWGENIQMKIIYIFFFFWKVV